MDKLLDRKNSSIKVPDLRGHFRVIKNCRKEINVAYSLILSAKHTMKSISGGQSAILLRDQSCSMD